MNIIDAIKERRSVRSYEKRSLTTSEIADLRKAVEESYTLFGGKVDIKLKSFDLKGDFKPSTYGVIKGATEYFLLGYADDEDSALSVGFQFEQVVLKAWQLGLGTCWIAGTLKSSVFNEGQTWPEGLTLKIVSPVGYPAEMRFMEKMMRAGVGSNKRKPFGELFFDGNFDKPLAEDSTFGESLSMLRLAPSSTNSQPWRVLVDGDKVRFYCQYRNIVSIVDCGIGICHFNETELYKGEQGRYYKEESYPSAPNGWRYIMTYERIG